MRQFGEVGAVDDPEIEPAQTVAAGSDRSETPASTGEEAMDAGGAILPPVNPSTPQADGTPVALEPLSASPPSPVRPRVNDAMRVLSRMQTDLDVLTDGKRAATYAEVYDAFDNAIKALGIRLPSFPAVGDDVAATKMNIDGTSAPGSGSTGRIRRQRRLI